MLRQFATGAAADRNKKRMMCVFSPARKSDADGLIFHAQYVMIKKNLYTTGLDLFFVVARRLLS
jgi:hypothetical protein